MTTPATIDIIECWMIMLDDLSVFFCIQVEPPPDWVGIVAYSTIYLEVAAT
jgi:hypothetical protein